MTSNSFEPYDWPDDWMDKLEPTEQQPIEFGSEYDPFLEVRHGRGDKLSDGAGVGKRMLPGGEKGLPKLPGVSAIRQGHRRAVLLPDRGTDREPGKTNRRVVPAGMGVRIK